MRENIKITSNISSSAVVLVLTEDTQDCVCAVAFLPVAIASRLPFIDRQEESERKG